MFADTLEVRKIIRKAVDQLGASIGSTWTDKSKTKHSIRRYVTFETTVPEKVAAIVQEEFNRLGYDNPPVTTTNGRYVRVVSIEA